MMEVIDGINQMLITLELDGGHLPNWIYILTVYLLHLELFIFSLSIIVREFRKVIKFVYSYFSDAEIKEFIEFRGSFVGHIEYEVDKLNREAEWNDSLYYTDIEAEMEFKKYVKLDLLKSENLIYWLNNLIYLMKNIRWIKSDVKIEKNLTKAIIKSKSQVFIIIGDAGSGKTVFLRHLFLFMVKKAKVSTQKDALIPIYLNLKQLNIEPDEISADNIHKWIINQLVTGKDRTVREFVYKNFERMLNNGQFFFIFDSFDEIPSVLDVQEESEIILKYSQAIDNFLHAGGRCRGLISSRPYRSPKNIDAQRITILPLSDNLIKKALKKYLRQEAIMSKQIWDDVSQREDLLAVVCNPFYLSLLIQYCKENNKLPESQFDLFEQFVQYRVKTDKDRLSYFGFTPLELIQHTQILAFAMTKTPNLGLEADVNQIRHITSEFDKASCWDPSKIEALLSALAYLKLGKKSYEVDKISFSFVHRRFHEYFCARYLKDEYQFAPFEQLNSDNRWREVLVLLCEVLPIDNLSMILKTARLTLKDENFSNPDLTKKSNIIETVRFLRDGFRSRAEDIPKDLKMLCSKFIQNQFENGTLLDKKRAIENLLLVEETYLYSLLESALKESSEWLNETALRSCYLLKHVPDSLSIAIRNNIYKCYLRLKIIQKYSLYSVLFSRSQVLKPFKQYLKILAGITIIQLLIYSGLMAYILTFNENTNLIVLGLVYIFFPFVFAFYLNKSFKKKVQDNYIGSLMIFPILTFVWNVNNVSSSNGLLYLSLCFILFDFYLNALVYVYPKNFSFLVFYPITMPLKIIKLRNWRFLLIKKFFYKSSVLVLFTLTLGVIIYLINKLYLHSSSIIAHLVLVIGISALVLIYFLAFYTSYLLLKPVYNFISDQFMLKKLCYSSDSRPSSSENAIHVLNSFKTDEAKTQYIYKLFEWLPREADIELFTQEAEKNNGEIKDLLFKLVEFLESSIDIK